MHSLITDHENTDKVKFDENLDYLHFSMLCGCLLTLGMRVTVVVVCVSWCVCHGVCVTVCVYLCVCVSVTALAAIHTLFIH